MGKFGCTCGRSISLNSAPELNEAVLVTDVALDSARVDAWLIQVPKRVVYECSGCGRLWVETVPRSNNFISFTPDGEHLNFREDYGKSYGSRYREEAKPEETGRRLCVVPVTKVLAPRSRTLLLTEPLGTAFKFKCAVVPESTPSAVLMHSPRLFSPTPVNMILTAECGRLGLHRDLFRPLYAAGDMVEMDVENTSGGEVTLRVAVVGWPVVDEPPSSSEQH